MQDSLLPQAITQDSQPQTILDNGNLFLRICALPFLLQDLCLCIQGWVKPNKSKFRGLNLVHLHWKRSRAKRKKSVWNWKMINFQMINRGVDYLVIFFRGPVNQGGAMQCAHNILYVQWTERTIMLQWYTIIYCAYNIIMARCDFFICFFGGLLLYYYFYYYCSQHLKRGSFKRYRKFQCPPQKVESGGQVVICWLWAWLHLDL